MTDSAEIRADRLASEIVRRCLAEEALGKPSLHNIAREVLIEDLIANQPTELFIIAWTGGYEATSYTVKSTAAEAWTQAELWWDDADQEGDTMDILRLDLTTLTLERLGQVDRTTKETA